MTGGPTLGIGAWAFVTLENTIVDGDCGGEGLPFGISFLSNGNLETGNDSCLLNPAINQVGVLSGDLALGPLAYNGGVTDTVGLGAGSLAIDAGDTINCDAVDQRGVTRDAACDVGAYEEVCFDLDDDGYGMPGSAVCPAGPEADCDDTAADVNPGQVEIPANGLDDDCDPSTPVGCSAEPLTLFVP